MKSCFFHKKDVTCSSTAIKGRYQSFVLSLNFYLPRLSAKQLSKECLPDPQPPREAMLPSHPTPNYSTNPCILQFRVSGGQCVSGALWCGWEKGLGWGSSVECCSSGGGMGWRLSSSGLPLKHSKKTKQHYDHGAFLSRPVCVQHISRVGTASFVVLVCLSGET